MHPAMRAKPQPAQPAPPAPPAAPDRIKQLEHQLARVQAATDQLRVTSRQRAVTLRALASGIQQQVANATAAFFDAFPAAMLTPHRWHKRYGSDARCGDADGCGTQPTGQNLCFIAAEGQRQGYRNQAVARVPVAS